MNLAINKTQLAKQYGRTLDFLRKNINTTPGLLNELRTKADYKLYQRVLTPMQIAIIYKYLGEPET
ncbi:MAG: DUF4248 domain-containing protein [Bacteroidales bacterium]|nr:DUF4248 domain-containing protein [Bacteroidales bacterium]